MRIAFVILHYMAERDTRECTKALLSILSCSSHKAGIVIVDNGSTNQSYESLYSVFSGNPAIHFLQSAENIGFARGNNLGIDYARKILHAEFVVCLNNDVIIRQTEFCDLLVAKYSETGYAVLGPDIETLDGYHTNPYLSWEYGTLRMARYRLGRYALIALCRLNLYGVAERIVGARNADKFPREAILGDRKDVFLQGSCWIFSPRYFEAYEGLDPRTFLYWEEQILRIHLMEKGLLSLYSGELRVLHKEAAATKSVHQSARERMIWREKEALKSSKVYEIVLRDYKQKVTGNR